MTSVETIITKATWKRVAFFSKYQQFNTMADYGRRSRNFVFFDKGEATKASSLIRIFFVNFYTDQTLNISGGL